MSAVPRELDLNPATAGFIREPKKMFIGGEWVAALSGRTFPVYNPATGEVISWVAEGEKADIDLAVLAAREAFENGPWASMSPSERAKIIWRIGDLINQYLDEFAELESLDNGKPIGVAKAADVPLAADIFHYMSGWATKIHGKNLSFGCVYTPGARYHSYTRPEPVGVVGQIIPWNFPLLMAAWKLAPALAAGCTVVLKVAEETPLSALRLGEVMQEAGLPKGAVNIVTGFGETAGAALAAHPGVDKVAFTGSTEVGKLIVKAAANDLKKISLELGGKSPNIVFKDADLDAAIPGSASAIFFNQGQCCSAGSRLYVEDSVFERVVEGVSDFAKNIKLGPGLDPKTEMGPMVSETQHKRVSGYLDIGRNSGARAVVGGNKVEGKGYFIEPTVLVDVRSDMKVMQEEIFGPVVCAVPFKTLDENLVQHANDSVYGLAAGIWTRDISKAHSLAAKILAGTVWINCYNVFDASLPFGGYKQSGWGREMGEEVLENYLETKAVTIRL
ncbi:MAG: aldehyde dehydrogenase family protein [Methylococcaceae bacterium]|nr:aldehyde dehydrogenase family protein [Methylococcaceae bacterium]